MKIKLMNIVVDPNIQVREVEGHTVSKYAQAMRAGSQFPPLLLEKGTNRIVCGNHRYYAYKRVLNPDDTVDVTTQTFKSESDIIRMAARDNAHHGRPLDTWDMKRIAAKLTEFGDSVEDIAALLSVPIERVDKWAGMTVVVRGNGKKKELKPTKHGIEHMAGKSVSPEDYDNHERSDYGIPIKNASAMITRHVEAGWIDTDDEKTMHNLRTLHTALAKFLN